MPDTDPPKPLVPAPPPALNQPNPKPVQGDPKATQGNAVPPSSKITPAPSGSPPNDATPTPPQGASLPAPESNPPPPGAVPSGQGDGTTNRNHDKTKGDDKEDGKARKPSPVRRSAFVDSTNAKHAAPGATSDDGTDPTEPLTERSRDLLYRSIINEAFKHAPRLREHGRLIVGCEHDGCAETASLELMSHPDIGAVRRRCVAGHEHKLDALLSPKWRARIGRSEASEGGQNVALLFYGSNRDSLEEVLQVLERRGRLGFSTDERFYVVIQLTGEAWGGFDAQTMSNTVPVWAVNARRHLLARYNTPAEDLDTKLEKIKAAQERGILPPIEAKLILTLEQRLIAGTLDALLDTPSGMALAKSPNENDLAVELLAGANEVEKCAVFVAATFPDLRVGEFELLMQKLLTQLPRIDGVRRRQSPRPATEYWSCEQESIFRRLHLGHRASLEGALVVEFTFPGLGEAMRRALFAPYQLAQLERLHAAGLLLNPNTPQRIVDALIEVTARFAPSHPDVYHRDWLMDRLRDIQQSRAEFATGASRVVQAVSIATPDWRGLLDEFRQHDRAHHRQLLGRLVAMCRGFLGNERTARIALGFLDDLVNGTKPDCDDAIEVIRRLRGAPNFDADARLRTLLDFVRTNLRAEIFRLLLAQMRDPAGQPEPTAAWRTLGRVAEWFPEKKEFDHLGEGARWALAFPYSVWEDYREWSLEHGGRESDTPIRWLQEDPDLPTPAERISKLTEWFAHPAFVAALNHVLKTTYTEHDKVYWELLELYFGPHFTVGEAFMADLLAGFYKQSGDERMLDLASLLARKLPRALLDKLRILIRQGADVAPDEGRRATAKEYPVLMLRLRRAYEFASRLGGAKTNTPRT